MTRSRALAVLLLLWSSATLVRIATLPDRGLRAQYFRNAAWQGYPAFRATDNRFSSRQLSRRWRFAPPEPFTAQWSGHLNVGRRATYTLALRADDEARLYVDQRLVAENGRDGRVTLEAGSHAVTLQYRHLAGPYYLEWLWGHDGEALEPISAWRLTSSARTPASVLLLRLLDWIWLALTGSVLGLAGAIVWGWGTAATRHTETPAVQHERLKRPTPRIAAALFLLFGVLAVVHTWPLASNPAGLSRNDNADTMLNEWTLAWVAHQLPRQPFRLADANIFYPERDTLAYSEMLIVQSLMGAPLLWLGASPVLTYNLLLLAGFTLTGWTMSLVVTRWTGDWMAGFTAGVIFAFNAHTLSRLPHLQIQHVEFLPLALLALDSTLGHPRWQSARWLALWFSLQALASAYLLVLTTVALGAALVARPEDWIGRRIRAAATALTLAAATAVLALVPWLLPYWRLRAQGLDRSLDEVAWFSASGQDYVTGVSHAHRWLGLGGGDTALFPGVAALVLAAVAMGSGVAFTSRRARMCLAAGAAGFYLSFGPVAPGYESLYDAFPPLQGIRAAARFGYLGIVGTAVLAGFGMAALRGRGAPPGSARRRSALLLLALVTIEPVAAPLGYQPFTGIPAIYASPRTAPGALVVELPFPPPETASRNSRYVLNSTRHWKPLLNGYSGFIPPSYYTHYEAFRSFPGDAAVAALKERGVTHVFVHVDQLTDAERLTLETLGGLSQAGQEGSVVLYLVN